MAWTAPSYVTSGEASSTQFNAETVDNLLYLKAAADAAPRGVMGTPVTIDTGSQALTTSLADLTGLAITFTAVAGRRYLIQAHVMFDNCPSPYYVTWVIARGSTGIANGHVTGATAGGNCFIDAAAHDAPGAGSVTYKVKAAVSSLTPSAIWTRNTASTTGGGSVSGPTTFIVLDIGAA